MEETREMDGTFVGVGSELGVSGTGIVEDIKDVGDKSSSFISSRVDLVGEDGVFGLGGQHNSFTCNGEG
ncbi:hypothetical protein TorRG33x02_324530 [Trema orientale]|uniref:Uncharacterized protein n=1 Tax=Trema orientale TaxID=63057 RepID=A0A2P5BDP7_TREOI|nr:hypothetical protein TorRG33x02_324530 [Trema orientale]